MTKRALAALNRFVGNTFALWILLFAVLAFYLPAWFLPLTQWIVPLLGLIMFSMGLTLGYLVGRVFGLPLAQRKTLSIEVGMQNSGLGAALASAHFSPLAAVPSALFSLWHNLSGSLLAAIYRRMDDGPRAEQQ
uniref:bile acid:sodium symporter family protein n=1 Tax=Pseudomonas sp. OTU5201 TaxID=3043850 RepID=UPI00313E23F1